MRSIVGGLIAGIMIVALGGCTVAKIDGRGATPILLNNPPERVEVIKHFEVSQGIMFDYTNAFDASDILAEVLQETNCDAIINIGLELQITVGDYCVNFCTFGFANAKHLVVVGDAVKAPEGLGMNFEEGDLLAESRNLREITSKLFELSQGDLSKYHIVKSDGGYQLVHFADL
ncbi:MAG: hypothetical protein GF355_15870 [Candidatus Eisenbacteria bacterium]|nr:hypothetical protein [Candidatus Eisenbacteria bacterium]